MSTTFSMGGRIAFERSAGWNRQLRLTALTGWQYVASKVLVGFSLGIPSLALVYVLGAAHGVHLSAGRWLASGVSIVVAVIPLAVAGIWVGYLVDKAESAQQLIGWSTRRSASSAASGSRSRSSRAGCSSRPRRCRSRGSRSPVARPSPAAGSAGRAR